MIKLYKASSNWPKLYDHINVRIDWYRGKGTLPIANITSYVQDILPIDSEMKEQVMSYLEQFFVYEEITQLQGILGKNIEIHEEVSLPVAYSKIKGYAPQIEFVDADRDTGVIHMTSLLPSAQQLPFFVWGYYDFLISGYNNPWGKDLNEFRKKTKRMNS